MCGKGVGYFYSLSPFAFQAAPEGQVANTAGRCDVSHWENFLTSCVRVLASERGVRRTQPPLPRPLQSLSSGLCAAGGAVAAGTPSRERVGGGAGGAEWSWAGAAVCSLSPRCVGPPGSLCQSRSSSLPRFASERGYRPRPEEPPGPKQQFVPQRVKREAQHPRPSKTHIHSHQPRKERSVARSTHPSSATQAKAQAPVFK